jgi:hypothetical protein
VTGRDSRHLADVGSPADFAECLRELYRTSGRGSAEAVARASHAAGQPIASSTVRTMLTGRSRPAGRSLIGFLLGCGVPPDSHRPWIEAYERAFTGTAPTPPAADPGRAGYARTVLPQVLAPFAGGAFLATLAQLLGASGWPVVVSVLAGGAGALLARWRWSVSRWQAAGGVALALLGLAGVLATAAWRPEPPVPVLSGDYNLAVAQFTNAVGDDLRADVAAEVTNFVPGLVQGVRTALDRATAPDPGVDLLRIDVQALPRTVAGAGPDDQLAAVRSLAARANADAVLFGTIGTDGAALVVTPHLWLSPSALLRAEEMSGVHALPSAREDITRPDAAIRLRRMVAGNAGDLARLVELVRLYDAGQYRSAVDLLRGFRGQHLLQPALIRVLEGNLTGKLGRFADAEAAYRAASSDPAYRARAQLGLLQVTYSAATGRGGRCAADVDVDALTGVVQGYAALAGTTGPAGANIGAKARFGEARARMCLDAAGRRDDGRGRGLLVAVVREYDLGAPLAPDDDLRELAAEAEALIGDHDSRRAATPAELAGAAGRLDRATRLTTFTERRLAFMLAHAAVLQRMGDSAHACDKLRQARALAVSSPSGPALPGLDCP